MNRKVQNYFINDLLKTGNVQNYIKIYLKGNSTEKTMLSTFIENNFNLDYSTFVYQINNKLYVSKLISEPEETCSVNRNTFYYNFRMLYDEIFSIFYNVYYNVLDKFNEKNIFNLYKEKLFLNKSSLLNEIYIQLSKYIESIEFIKIVENKSDYKKFMYPESEIKNNYKYNDINIHCFDMKIKFENGKECYIIFDCDDIFLEFSDKKEQSSFHITNNNEIIKSNTYLIKSLYGYSLSKFYIKLCDIYDMLKNLILLPKLCSDYLLNGKSSLYYFKILDNFENLKDFLCVLFFNYPEINDDLDIKIVDLKKGLSSI